MCQKAHKQGRIKVTLEAGGTGGHAHFLAAAAYDLRALTRPLDDSIQY